jgi:succinoglycan biosynthesis transport protein ExoP
MSRYFELLQRAGQRNDLLSLDEMEAPVLRERQPISRLRGKSFDGVHRFVNRLLLMPGTERPKILVLAAAQSGDGCSWLTARAAEILSDKIEGDVCAVDANFCSPALHDLLGVENKIGLSDAILENGPIGNFTVNVQGNLWCLPSGTHAGGSERLIQSERFGARIAEMRSRFECVLIDSPALSVSAQAASVARCSDGVVLVVRAESTRRDVVRSVARDLQSSNLRLLGAVLNDRVYPVPQSVYSRV